MPENFVPRMDKLGMDQHKPRCRDLVDQSGDPTNNGEA